MYIELFTDRRRGKFLNVSVPSELWCPIRNTKISTQATWNVKKYMSVPIIRSNRILRLGLWALKDCLHSNITLEKSF